MVSLITIEKLNVDKSVDNVEDFSIKSLQSESFPIFTSYSNRALRLYDK